MFVDHKSFALVSALLLAGCTEPSQTGESDAFFSGNMVLAISWQSAFCETRPRLPECRTQNAARYDADHFSLHGLWPQPRSKAYCGVDDKTQNLDRRRKWKQLSGLGLSDALKEKLWKIMPGARSYLHRHEWIKHGTCYSKSPETYYAHSISLMDTINASSVRDLFANNRGKSLSGGAIRNAFDEAFGDGVGARVRIACKRDGRREIITEITLGLAGAITDRPDITALSLAAPKTKAGCPSGIVDPVGFQ